MIIDKNNIFNSIALEVEKVLPNSRYYVKGSRIGDRPGNKYDFDIIVWQTIYVERKEYIRNVKTLYDSVSSIKEYFRNNVIDEFGNPVIIDFFFIAVDPQIEDYREIKITK